MFLDVRLDVANAFVFENLIDSDENAGLLNVSETIIDGGAEELHSRTEVHVCVDEWWDVESERTDAAIENADNAMMSASKKLSVLFIVIPP